MYHHIELKTSFWPQTANLIPPTGVEIVCSVNTASPTGRRKFGSFCGSEESKENNRYECFSIFPHCQSDWNVRESFFLNRTLVAEDLSPRSSPLSQESLLLTENRFSHIVHPNHSLFSLRSLQLLPTPPFRSISPPFRLQKRAELQETTAKQYKTRYSKTR